MLTALAPIIMPSMAGVYLNGHPQIKNVAYCESSISQQLDTKYQEGALAFRNCIVIDVYRNSKILEDFERRFLANSKEIEPEFMAVINEHIWDLV